jgi:hypothetical protein
MKSGTETAHNPRFHLTPLRGAGEAHTVGRLLTESLNFHVILQVKA